MKLKKGLIAASVALALIVPTTVFAATSNSTAAMKIRGLFGIDTSKLSASQLADVKDYAQKMADLQKNLLDKMVSNGSMTRAQADVQKAQIDSNLANGEVFVGAGHGGKDFNGFKGKIDTSKLTDAQKNSLLELQKEQLNLQNELIKLLVEQNLITQAQADTLKANIDAAVSSLTTSNHTSKMFGGYQCGLDLLEGISLTDAQKTALKDWSVKAASVEKKLVALYKDSGLITQTQADSMNSRIDEKASDPLAFDKMANGRMSGKNGHGKMGGRH